jgi:hypothetical protein
VRIWYSYSVSDILRSEVEGCHYNLKKSRKRAEESGESLFGRSESDPTLGLERRGAEAKVSGGFGCRVWCPIGSTPCVALAAAAFAPCTVAEMVRCAGGKPWKHQQALPLP